MKKSFVSFSKLTFYSLLLILTVQCSKKDVDNVSSTLSPLYLTGKGSNKDALSNRTYPSTILVTHWDENLNMWVEEACTQQSEGACCDEDSECKAQPHGSNSTLENTFAWLLNLIEPAAYAEMPGCPNVLPPGTACSPSPRNNNQITVVKESSLTSGEKQFFTSEHADPRACGKGTAAYATGSGYSCALVGEDEQGVEKLWENVYNPSKKSGDKAVAAPANGNLELKNGKAVVGCNSGYVPSADKMSCVLQADANTSAKSGSADSQGPGCCVWISTGTGAIGYASGSQGCDTAPTCMQFFPGPACQTGAQTPASISSWLLSAQKVCGANFGKGACTWSNKKTLCPSNGTLNCCEETLQSECADPNNQWPNSSGWNWAGAGTKCSDLATTTGGVTPGPVTGGVTPGPTNPSAGGTGACSFADGTCSASANYYTASICAADGGTFHGVGSTCGGACKKADGTCVSSTGPNNCASLGGTFQGVGSTTCAVSPGTNNPVAPGNIGSCNMYINGQPQSVPQSAGVGACEYTSQSGDQLCDCKNYTATSCSPGTFHGAGTNCNGSCTKADGTCVSATGPYNCTSQGGVTFKWGGVCGGNANPIISSATGACVARNNTCTEGQSSSLCIANNGNYLGDNTKCSGACVRPSFGYVVCEQQTESDCRAYSSSRFLGAGSQCSNSAVCSEAGGTLQGNTCQCGSQMSVPIGSNFMVAPCGSTGACYTDASPVTCRETVSSWCTSNQYYSTSNTYGPTTHFYLGQKCLVPGPNQVLDGTVPRLVCAPGYAQGAGGSCYSITPVGPEPKGACVSGPTCQLLSDSDCSAINGQYHGDNTTCSSVGGVCCSSSNSGSISHWWVTGSTYCGVGSTAQSSITTPADCYTAAGLTCWQLTMDQGVPYLPSGTFQWGPSTPPRTSPWQAAAASNCNSMTPWPTTSPGTTVINSVNSGVTNTPVVSPVTTPVTGPVVNPFDQTVDPILPPENTSAPANYSTPMPEPNINVR